MSKFIATIQKQLDDKLPFVVYRKPSETTVTAIFQKDDVIHFAEDYTEIGFVFAPFDATQKSILIPIDRKLTTNTISKNTVKHAVLKVLFNKENHIALVEKAIQNLQARAYDKIVLSRSINLKLNEVDSVALFQHLQNLYDSAFVYLWYHPKVGCWLGATPEILLQTRGNTFKTMSLAGTQQFADNIVWKPKETEEQEIVTNFIYSNLKPITSSITLNKPITVKAGDLTHIRTDISGRFQENQLNEIIKTLHPTPAVCGVPKEKAKQFILDNEGYNREYYTGFLGELNFETTRKNNRRNTENHAYNLSKKSSNLFVNLRCMQVIDNTVNIYVGGGITANSDALSEYQETVNKAQTIQVIFE